MDKIGRPEPAELLSHQVSGASYFFLNLAPKRVGPMAVALGGRETCDPDYAIDRRGYAYLGLEYVAEGGGWVALDGRRQALGPGVVFAYGRRTHCEMRADPARPMVKYFLCVAGAAAARRLARAGCGAGEARALSAHAEIRSLFEDIIREGRRAGPLAPAICATLLQLLLLKVQEAAARRMDRSAVAQEGFLRCKALIDARAADLDSLGEVAAAAGMEASSLCRLFRRHQGTSPYQYLLRCKMRLAAEFLIESGGLVKEAAQRVGFADPYHFSRCFKAVHGVAPRHLRRYRQAG